jgi:MFS family permease
VNDAMTPATRRSSGFLLALALAYAGGVTAYLPLLSLLLPVQVGTIGGEAKVGILTACVIAGALAASGSNILFGWLSDRSLARGGGRRRWLTIGAGLTLAAYAGIALAAKPITIVLAVAGFQFAVNGLLAPLMAIMADEVPDAQKGVAGGLLALGMPAASAVGALLLGIDTLDQTGRLLIVPLVSAAACLPLLFITHRPGAQPVLAPQARRQGFAIASAARLLMQVAGNVLGYYLLFYFESIVPAGAPGALAARTGNVLTIVYLASLPLALVAGRIADHSGQRKPVLVAAAVMAALGLAGMALAASWTVGAVAFGVYAIGSTVFLALHATFAMQLLPDPRHRGRDLGLFNLTNTLPALVGPLLTWALATPGDFSAVMIVLAVLSLASGVAMLAVRDSAPASA